MEEDQAKMLETEAAVTTEKSPFVTSGKITTDDVVEELFRRRNWKYTLLLLSMIITWPACPTMVYLSSFAGLSPNNILIITLVLFYKPSAPSIPIPSFPLILLNACYI